MDEENINAMTYNDYRSHQQVRRPKSGMIYPDAPIQEERPQELQPPQNVEANRATSNQRFLRDTFVSDVPDDPEIDRNYLFNRDTLKS